MVFDLTFIILVDLGRKILHASVTLKTSIVNLGRKVLQTSVTLKTSIRNYVKSKRMNALKFTRKYAATEEKSRDLI